MIRVLIAEDSPTARTYLKQLLSEAPDLEVVGEAHDGEEAVRFTHELKPDVVTMDIHMPQLDGLAATRRIMAEVPTPVVVVSGLLAHDVDLSLQAIASGALAVVPKPPARNAKDFATRRHELLTTIKAMAEVKVVARRDHLRSTQPARPVVSKRARPQLIAIGASTGGPSALQRVLSALPADFPVPIVIVQHMPDEFISGLVRWLDKSTPLSVQLAQHGMPLQAGMVVVATGSAHCLVERRDGDLVIVLARDESGEERYQPSVNLLFESVREACGRDAVGVLLTGMGSDGAEGLARLQEAGALTIVQDALSSTVHGMPDAALKRNPAHEVLPLSDIPTRFIDLL